MPGAVRRHQARPGPAEGDQDRADALVDELAGGGRGGGRVGLVRPPRHRRRRRRAPRRWASSGRARRSGSAATSAASGPSLVSTATRAGVLRSDRTSSAYQPSGAPGGSEPASTTHEADAARDSRVAPRSSRWDADTMAPGLLSLVVVPSGSVMARLMRTSPAGGAGEHAMPAERSSVTNGSSGRAGKTASVARPGRHGGAGDVHALAAGLHGDRQQPLDGAALQRAGQGDGAVVAGVRGQGDDHRDPVVTAHTVITSTPALLDGPAITGGDLLVGDEGVDLGQLGELDRAFHADLAGVGEHDDASRPSDDGALDGGLGAVGRGQAVLDGQAVGADEGEVGADLSPAPRRSPDRRPRGCGGGPGPAAGAARSAASRPAGRRWGRRA